MACSSSNRPFHTLWYCILIPLIIALGIQVGKTLQSYRAVADQINTMIIDLKIEKLVGEIEKLIKQINEDLEEETSPKEKKKKQTLPSENKKSPRRFFIFYPLFAFCSWIWNYIYWIWEQCISLREFIRYANRHPKMCKLISKWGTRLVRILNQ